MHHTLNRLALMAAVAGLFACGENAPEGAGAGDTTADVANLDGGAGDGGQASDTGQPADVGDDVAADTSRAQDSGRPSDAHADAVMPPVDAAAGDDASAAPAPCTTAADCGPTGSSCTAFECASFGCNEVVRPNGSVCEDGDPCTLVDTCQQGGCTSGEAKDCDDGDPCTVGACQPSSGACNSTILPGHTCEDGEPCTANDSCDDEGACQPGVGICVCSKDADCKDDGNVCNGTLYCDKSGATPVCKVNPATVVQCSSGKDTDCLANTCDPLTGICALTPRPDDTPCEDGVVCTKGDLCQAGSCKPGPGTCCTSHVDCPDNGDLCDGVPYCDIPSGLCQVNPFSVVTCASVDDTACMANTCVPSKGACVMQPRPDGTVCSDGDPCTVGDVCKSGSCQSGTGICQCGSNADCAKHEDGDACNGTLFCNQATGACQINPLTVVTCSAAQDTACAENRCDSKTGACAMVPLPDGVTCDADGSACTQGDACKDGACTVGAVFLCECTADKDCAAFEDGDKCNGSLFCDVSVGKCRLNPATIPYCPPGADTACLQNRCQPKSGTCKMVPLPDGVTCDADSNPCTPYDSCFEGGCQASANVCPCQQDGDCAAHEDGSLCTGTLYCAKQSNVCVPNPKTIVTCPSWQDDACLANRCDPKTGTCSMVPVRSFARCDADGNPCTAYDTCFQGGCVGGANLCDCNLDDNCVRFEDDDQCTGKLYCDQGSKPFRCKPNPVSTVTCKPGVGCATQVCDPKTGSCGAGPMALGKVCDDGDPCTVGDACAATGCTGEAKDCGASDACKSVFCDAKTGGCGVENKVCGDDNICTDDACDAELGCVFTAAAAKACDDGDVCTGKDACQGGVCTGTAIDCDDGDPCTADACSSAGCAHTAALGACDDGSKCTEGEVCTAGKCVGKAVSCDDGNTCTADACDQVKGCVHDASSTATCDDGDACVIDTVCSKGICGGGVAKQCDDGEPCTKDVCTATKGCVNTAFNDNAPCEGPDGCTIGGICTSGTCQGAVDKLHQRYFDAKGVTDIRALVSDTAGGAWLVGRGLDGSKPKPAWQGLVVRIDGTGKQTWFTRYGDSALLDQFEAAAATASGGLMLVGYQNEGAGARAWAVATDAAGQVKASRQFSQWQGELHAAAAVGETIVACGHMVVGKSSPRPLVVGLSATTQLKWKIDDQSGSDARWTAAVADGDGAVLGGDDRGVLTLFERRSANGALRWHRRVPNARSSIHVAQIARWSGGLVAAGDFSSGAYAGWVMALDPSGRLRWRREYLPKGFGMLVGAVGVHSSGAIHVFGSANNLARSLRLNSAGVLIGTTDYGHYANTPAAAWVGGDDSVFVVGSGAESYKGVTHPWTLRLDAYGHASCAKAGACWALGSKGCDDGKSCTHDHCASDAGCEHTAAAAATDCDDAGPCSLTAACDASGGCGSAKPRLGSTLGAAVGGRMAGAALTADGIGLEAGGEALQASGPLVPLLRVRDGRGGVIADHRPQGISGEVTAMVLDPGGPASVYGHTGGGALLIAHFGVGMTGAARWSSNAKWTTLAAGDTPRVVAATVVPSGWRVAVGTRLDGQGKPQGFACRTAVNDVVGPLVTVGASPDGSRLDGVRAVGTDALMVGQSGAVDTGLGWMVRQDGSGKTLWQQTHKPTSGLGGLRAVVPLGAGSLGAGWAGKGGARRVWLVAVDDKGGALWSKEHPLLGGAARGLDLAADAVGGFVGLASLGVDDGQVGLFAIDAEGRLAWQRAASASSGHAARALHLSLVGDLLVAGAATVGGVERAEVIRTDAWGVGSCAGSGACLGLGAVACDDGKVCTADACDGAKGCVSAPHPGCP
ncbi:MAG: hypothetical protein H6747_07885 [Deltaproteobacteria bacterium]|nr:hypothetical protein [Deltaproteobacteria bacterium]